MAVTACHATAIAIRRTQSSISAVACGIYLTVLINQRVTVFNRNQGVVIGFTANFKSRLLVITIVTTQTKIGIAGIRRVDAVFIRVTCQVTIDLEHTVHIRGVMTVDALFILQSIIHTHYKIMLMPASLYWRVGQSGVVVTDKALALFVRAVAAVTAGAGIMTIVVYDTSNAVFIFMDHRQGVTGRTVCQPPGRATAVLRIKQQISVRR